MRTLARTLTALLLATAIGGVVATCGNKGPLRPPEETGVVAAAPAAHP